MQQQRSNSRVPRGRVVHPAIMIIRHCGRADLDALEWDGAYTHDREIIGYAFVRSLERSVVMLVAEIDRELVGQVWIDLMRVPESAYVWALRVKPAWRGRGIGEALVRAAERAALAAGLGMVELDLEPHNRRARRFYERLGYALVWHREGVERLGMTLQAPDASATG